jgi:hypothetical protein
MYKRALDISRSAGASKVLFGSDATYYSISSAGAYRQRLCESELNRDVSDAFWRERLGALRQWRPGGRSGRMRRSLRDCNARPMRRLAFKSLARARQRSGGGAGNGSREAVGAPLILSAPVFPRPCGPLATVMLRQRAQNASSAMRRFGRSFASGLPPARGPLSRVKGRDGIIGRRDAI